MQKGLDLNTLAQRLLDEASAAVDIKVPVPKLHADVEGTSFALTYDAKGAVPLALTEVAHGQLAEYVGIPKRYYDRVRDANPALLAEQVNYWFEREHKEETRLVRTFSDGVGEARVPRKARAFLSDIFNPGLDNLVIAQAIIPLLSKLGAEVTSSNLTERAFYLQAVVPTVQREIKVGDVVDFGIAVRNSEVGLGAFSIESFVRVLRCLNGMKGKSIFRKAHLGRGYSEEEGVFLSEQSRKLLDAGTLSKLRDGVQWAFSDKHADEVADQIKAAAGVEVKKPEKAIEFVAKRFELSAEEREAVLHNLIAGGDTSVWGLSNAVTRIAHEGDYDRAVELESIGSQVIDLPRSAWSEVV